MTQEQFQKLQKKWYKKLKASGFEDVEANPSKWTAFVQRSPEYVQEAFDYFTAFTHLANSEGVDSTKASVYRLHGEGLFGSEIAQRLNMDLKTVRDILQNARKLYIYPHTPKNTRA